MNASRIASPYFKHQIFIYAWFFIQMVVCQKLFELDSSSTIAARRYAFIETINWLCLIGSTVSKMYCNFTDSTSINRNQHNRSLAITECSLCQRWWYQIMDGIIINLKSGSLQNAWRTYHITCMVFNFKAEDHQCVTLTLSQCLMTAARLKTELNKQHYVAWPGNPKF